MRAILAGPQFVNTLRFLQSALSAAISAFFFARDLSLAELLFGCPGCLALETGPDLADG